MNKIEMARTLAKSICSVPFSVSIEQCYEKQKNRSDLPCSDYDKCRILEKSEDQLEYVLSSINQNVFLDACPGAGKTEVVGLKAAYEMKNWNRSPSGITVLTFTNNARDVISDRVMQFVGNKGIGFPHFIGTFDSWLHGYIGHPFGYRYTEFEGIEKDRSIRLIDDGFYDPESWLSNYKLRTYYAYYNSANYLITAPLYANSLRYDLKNDSWEFKKPFSRSNSYISDEKYFSSKSFKDFRKDKPWLTLNMIKDGFSENKNEFLKNGFATYHDIEIICANIALNSDELIRKIRERFPIILIDECQDLSWIQLLILQNLVELGTRLHFIGDINQAIWEFRKVEPTEIVEFVKSNKFLKKNLKQNFRSNQQIVNICGQIVKQDESIEGNTDNDEDPCIYFFYDGKNPQSIPRLFSNYLKVNRMEINNSCIVARGHAMVNRMRPGGTGKIEFKKLLPTALSIWKTDLINSKSEAIECAGKFLSERFYAHDHRSSNENYCPKSYDSKLKWRLDIASFLNTCFDQQDLINLKQTWKEWCKEFNEKIVKIVKGAGFQDLRNPVDMKKMTSPISESKKEVSSTLGTVQSATKSKIRISTIHNVKGETFDAVLLVSNARKGKGGNWNEWLEDNKHENARFAYVASSRPKYLLAWAIPEPKEKDKDKDKRKIEKLGFKFVDICKPEV
jgi:DNA helicase II / ATP-dependent DNA helicase PcrA